MNTTAMLRTRTSVCHTPSSISWRWPGRAWPRAPRLAGLAARPDRRWYPAASRGTTDAARSAARWSANVHVHDPRFYARTGVRRLDRRRRGLHAGLLERRRPDRAGAHPAAEPRGARRHGRAGWRGSPRRCSKLLHWLNRNTRDGSRRNIAAHYDLGNDFFALVPRPDDDVLERDLRAADACHSNRHRCAKLERICRKLDLRPGDHLLEIGTGWGGLALHAARHYGCRVTTTTISREQHELARERIAEAGLEDRITLLLEDYRDLSGEYDKLVSIEMIEAVGHEYYDTYFAPMQRAAQARRPDAAAGDHHRRPALRRGTPISGLHPAVHLSRQLHPVGDGHALGLHPQPAICRLVHLEDIGPHYATTLRMWRENFFSATSMACAALGYPEEFIRMWEFYLCYCEGGFAERALGDVHMLLAKPGNRGIGR